MARTLAGTVTPVTMARLLAAVVGLAMTAPFHAIVFAQTPDDPGVYKGRKIADVMSFRGAGWLERASRIEEENPDALIAALPIEEGMLVVDIGCGSATTPAAWRRWSARKAVCCATTFSPRCCASRRNSPGARA